MLTEYKGQIYNAEIQGNNICIWKYIPVKGFEKVVTRRGLTYYEKTVDMSEVGPFYSVTFIVFKDKMKCTVKSFLNGKIEVICDDREYAETHGLSEVEHGVWCAQKQVDYFDKIQLIKSIENLNANANIEYLMSKKSRELSRQYSADQVMQILYQIIEEPKL